jgi:hypothetical protein
VWFKDLELAELESCQKISSLSAYAGSKSTLPNKLLSKGFGVDWTTANKTNDVILICQF